MYRFLSYCRLGTACFRIYLQNAKDGELVDLFSNQLKSLKENEDKLTACTNGIEPVSLGKLKFKERRVLYFERMKVQNYEDDIKIALNAIKTTELGMVSGMKYLNKNRNVFLHNFEEVAKSTIDQYMVIIAELKNYIIKKL